MITVTIATSSTNHLLVLTTAHEIFSNQWTPQNDSIKSGQWSQYGFLLALYYSPLLIYYLFAGKLTPAANVEVHVITQRTFSTYASSINLRSSAVRPYQCT